MSATDTTTDVPELYWDPFDEVIDASPYDTWRRMRDEAPVYRNERFDFYALSRFDDVEDVHRDPRVFSSSHGTVLEFMSEKPSDFGMMIFMDPPAHTKYRALVSRAFTPRRVSGLEPHIRALCNELLDAWEPGKTFDIVEQYGGQLPSLVITELLGVDLADRAMVKTWIDGMFYIEPGVGMFNDKSAACGLELTQYLAEVIKDRQAHPADDMLSALVQAEVAGTHGPQRLDVHQATSFANLLISAGTETVARLVGWAAVALDEFPDQRAVLVEEPELIPNGVEELLRYESPSPVQGRWTNEAVELHGTTIPAGSKVLLLTGSAGRDERMFADPDRVDVRRSIGRHLSFGYGIHFCLGAALARLEGRIALEELLRRHPTWTVDRDAAVQQHTSTVRGWSSVPVS